jgi:plasmid maintenance system antidote protein VapI
MEEQEHVRVAMRYLRARAGSWRLLGKALGFKLSTMRHVRSHEKNVSPTMALRLARFAGVTVDDLLTGKYPPAGACPHCGCVS